MTEKDLGIEIVNPWPPGCDTCGHPLSVVPEGEYAGWLHCDPHDIRTFRREVRDEEGFHEGRYEVVEQSGCDRYYLRHQATHWVQTKQ